MKWYSHETTIGLAITAVALGIWVAVTYEEKLPTAAQGVPAQDYTFFQEAYQKHLSYEKQLIEAKAAIQDYLAIMINSEESKQGLTRLITEAMSIRLNARELVERYNRNAIRVSNDTFNAWQLPRRLEALP